MPDRMQTDSEKDLLKVLKNEIDFAQEALSLASEQKAQGEEHIAETEAFLRSIGYGDALAHVEIKQEPQADRTLVIRSFDDLLQDANERYPEEIGFEDIFSDTELAENRECIRQLNAEFNAVHKLDAVDVIIPAMAGVLGGVIDCFLGGLTKSVTGKDIPGSKPGGLNDYVRSLYDKALPKETIKKLEKLAKVPYDALNYDNKKNIIVEEMVDGLSSWFHHQVSLGHDPILGFIFGVFDMLHGTVTTLDFKGKFLVQMAHGYSDKKAQNLFQAIATVFIHMLSDVNGSSKAKNGGRGLPAPFMALFNKLQFGSIGKDEQIIADLVKSMYGQGYDFRHFCAMSIPVMIIEVVVRVSYFIKRLAEGYSFKEAIPFGTNHEKKPKLGTMLFIAHSASTAINAGKIIITENPLDINYPQWMSFARYTVKQLKWAVIDKPELRDQYVMNAINDEWNELAASMDNLWNEYAGGAGNRARPPRPL